MINLFGNAAYYNEILSQTVIYHKDLKTKADFCNEIMAYFRKIKRFDQTLPELYNLVEYYSDNENAITADVLTDTFAYFDNEEEQIWQEQILTYSLLRYFVQGSEDGDFYNKYMIGLVLLYICYLAEMVLYYHCWSRFPDYDERVMMIVHISRLIEHNNSFRNRAIAHFHEKGMTDPFLFLG